MTACSTAKVVAPSNGISRDRHFKSRFDLIAGGINFCSRRSMNSALQYHEAICVQADQGSLSCASTMHDGRRAFTTSGGASAKKQLAHWPLLKKHCSTLKPTLVPFGKLDGIGPGGSIWHKSCKRNCIQSSWAIRKIAKLFRHTLANATRRSLVQYRPALSPSRSLFYCLIFTAASESSR